MNTPKTAEYARLKANATASKSQPPSSQLLRRLLVISLVLMCILVGWRAFDEYRVYRAKQEIRQSFENLHNSMETIYGK